MLLSEVVPPAHRATVGGALAAFAGCVLLLFLTQRHGILSRLGGRLAGTRFAGRLHALVTLVEDVEETPDHLLHTRAAALRDRRVPGVHYWAFGMLQTHATMAYLGRPISWRDAWMIEAALLLVHSVFFLVPANLGTQEAVLVTSCAAITSSSTLGLAMAIIRRALELAWVGVGLLVGWTFSWTSVPGPVH